LPSQQKMTLELVPGDLRIDSPETLAQRRRVRELVLSDLGVDLSDTSSAPATRLTVSTVSACPTDLPPCFGAPLAPPVPAHTACLEKTPTCGVVVASTGDVVSTSPARQGDASERSPATRPGFDASQRRAPDREMADRMRRGLRAQLLNDAALNTPSNISIVSTRPTAQKSCVLGCDASTRTPVNVPALRSAVDVATPPLNIVSTVPAAPKSTTPIHDASTRIPVTCPEFGTPTTPFGIVSMGSAALKSTTSNHVASTRRSPSCSSLAGQPMHSYAARDQSAAVKCWLLGVGCDAGLSGEELAKALRAAAPETYED
jgi:hypothetical protein